ncbi:MAG: DUF4136 domain-containing protein [Desulfuromonas sp.]|nr:DUF4136 domain-containing protein [Desulfuromonas sp.]
MIRRFQAAMALLSLATLMVACSSTTLNSSWKDPEFRGPVHKIYLVGVAKQEINRRIFEDTFERELATLGATGIASYRDLPQGEADNQDAVVASLNKHGADAILMARMVNMRIEQVTSPGYVSGGSTWNGYYARRYDAVYYPPTTAEFQIATIEANLYETRTGKLIWSAQLETVVENNIEKLFNDFVKVVAKDLRKQGLI